MKKTRRQNFRRQTLDNVECPFEGTPVGCVASHFFDSGSFSLWTTAEKHAHEHNVGDWEFYETDEFWQYMERYVAFVKRHRIGIDYCANVDVLPFRSNRRPPKDKTNAELSWRNLKWLESKGLSPVPVVHLGTPLEELQRYIEDGYSYIGLGGLVGSTKAGRGIEWINKVFEMICPDGKPLVRLHGFGVTSWKLLLSYPWSSVDSTSWTKAGGFGNLYVPHKRRGEFVFTEPPYAISTSFDSPARKKTDHRSTTHLFAMTKGERAIVEEWLEKINIPIGEWNEDRETVSYGVVTRHTERRIANLLYFHHMFQELPDLPWRFKSTRSRGFGFGKLDGIEVDFSRLDLDWKEHRRPTIYYSGCAGIVEPEQILGDDATIMLSYHDMHTKDKPNTRFASILKKRKNNR